TIGHVHSGALGWVAFIVFGSLYYLIPVLWNRKALYSVRLVAWHYWIATLGIVLYIVAMWVAGIMEGLMWRAYDKFGFLQYSFVESVVAIHPFFVIRLLGGVFFLIGGLLMVFNVFMTITSESTERPRERLIAPAVLAGA
ncbi:MAG TPA: cytochrome oxidase, partial [Acetobacteraceae bacterium]|nr:cytochrome oxidase [Acetobacteraceae bacterium]